jgi:type I restriction enzyme S subunit
MPENTKTPAIRYAEFTGAWEQRRLGEMAEFNPKATLPDVFEYVDLESVVGTDLISHRTEEKSSAPSRAQRLARRGDVFYQTVRPYQKNNYLFEKPDNNYVFSTGYAQMRPNIDAQFLFCIIQVEQFVKTVLDHCTGTSYPAINANDLADIEVKVPSDKDEQVKVGTFFKHLDALITLHQREYDKTVNIKKSLLEKMFPKGGEDKPEIRFTGFTGAWEQRRLGDLLNEVKRPVTLMDNEEYQLVIVKRRNEGVFPRAVLKGKDILVKSYFEVRAGDYLISKRQVVHGANGIVPKSLDKAIVSNEYLVSTGNDLISVDFLALLSKRPEMYRKFFISSYGVDIEKLVFDVEDWKKRTALIPSKDEQRKICSFFDTISDLITLHQRELEKLQNMKKALLEKMFA